MIIFFKKESCCLLACGKWAKVFGFLFGKVTFHSLSTVFPQRWALFGLIISWFVFLVLVFHILMWILFPVVFVDSVPVSILFFHIFGFFFIGNVQKIIVLSFYERVLNVFSTA